MEGFKPPDLQLTNFLFNQVRLIRIFIQVQKPLTESDVVAKSLTWHKAA
jgi:hypothetical protein